MECVSCNEMPLRKVPKKKEEVNNYFHILFGQYDISNTWELEFK